MPSDNPEPQESDNPEKPVSDSQSTTYHSSSPNSGEEPQRSVKSKEKERKRNKPRGISITKIPKIDVIESVEANKIAKTANTISRYSVIINALIFAITAAVAGVAMWQGRSAESAANTAKNTLDEIKKYDSYSLKMQRDAFDKQNSNYLLEHEPFLEVSVDTLKYIKDSTHYYPSKPMELSFFTFASTERPIRVIREGFTLKLGTADTNSFLKHPFDNLSNYNPSDFYVFKSEKGLKRGIPIRDSLNYIQGGMITGRIIRMYFMGRIDYENYLTQKKRRYEFVIVVSYENGVFGFYYLRDRNIDL